MKKKSLLIISLLACLSSPLAVFSSEWSHISPVLPGIDRNGVWGTSASDIYVVSGDIEDGTIMHYDGSCWSLMTVTTESTDFAGVWGSASNDVFVVGTSIDVDDFNRFYGKIFHYNGNSWSEMTVPTTEEGFLNGVWGSASNDVFAVGVHEGQSIILHYNGNNWTEMTIPPMTDWLYDVWGSSHNNVYAVSMGGEIIHYNGSSWSEVAVPTTSHLEGIWGSSPTDIFAVGVGSGGLGIILHYDGNNWTEMTIPPTDKLNGIWGTSPSDVFAVGSGSPSTSSNDMKIFHYDGNSWAEMAVPRTGGVLADVWGISGSDVFAVGSGSILHYDGNSWSEIPRFYALGSFIWGSSENDVFAAGGWVISHYDGTSWNAQWILESDSIAIQDLWGSGSNDVFAVGGPAFGWDDHSIFHYNGTSWTVMTTPGSYLLLEGVWGSASNDVFAVGYDPIESEAIILHYDGSSWTIMTIPPTSSRLYDVWGTSSTDVFAVGNHSEGYGIILRYDGNSWREMTLPPGEGAMAIWGTSSTDVFAVAGSILHYDGDGDNDDEHLPDDIWEIMEGTIGGRDVWGSGSNDVYVVTSENQIGGAGIYHYNGSNWTAASSPPTVRGFGSVWGSAWNDVFVGEFVSNTILHYDGSGSSNNTFCDGDDDTYFDVIDNCPSNYNSQQLNSDNHNGGDICDPCPADPTDNCNPDGSEAGIISNGGTGGIISTPDGSLSIDVPPSAVGDNTEFSITNSGSGYQLETDLGDTQVVLGVQLESSAASFNQPVTIHLEWLDEELPNGNGEVDGFDNPIIYEADIFVVKDGEIITDECVSSTCNCLIPPDLCNPCGCNLSANYFEIDVTSFSEFALAVPFDSDGDGVPDNFDGVKDNCPDVSNTDQADTGDNDGVGDVCDNCPSIPNGPLLGTCINCTTGITGGSCVSDIECGAEESCTITQEDICGLDVDGDGLDGVCDNCTETPNADQLDTYPPEGNGIGDACDCESDFNCDGNVDATDVTSFLVDFGRSTFFNPCTNADPCNGDVDCNVNVDADDVTKFLEDFGRSKFFNPCPACVAGAWCVY